MIRHGGLWISRISRVDFTRRFHGGFCVLDVKNVDFTICRRVVDVAPKWRSN